MSTTAFNSTRFSRLIRVYFKENGRSLTRAIFSFFIISLAIWLIITSLLISDSNSFHMALQMVMFIFIGIIAPTLASGWFYGRLNSPERQISFLVIPATHFEKHLLSTLMSIVVPAIAGLLTYYVCEIVCIELHRALAEPKYFDFDTNAFENFYGQPLILHLIDEKITFTFLFVSYSLYSFFAAFIQFFSLHFTKNLIFKLALLMVLLTTFISTYIFLVLENLHISENRLFSYTADLTTSFLGHDLDGSETLLFALPALFSSLVLWYAGYVRLKEFQIH